MHIVPEIIKSIQLLAGSHADTGTTGRGCFMNVIAYLNGELVITDRSDCVCVVVRPIAIWLNDCAARQRRGADMLPFVLRAMGSATTDPQELSRRTWLTVTFAKRMRAIAMAAAEATRRAAKAAAETARWAANTNAAANRATAAETAAMWAIDAAAETAAMWAAGAAGAHVANAAAIAAAWTAKAVAANFDAAAGEIIDAGIAFLDAALPQIDGIDNAVAVRAAELRRLIGAAT